MGWGGRGFAVLSLLCCGERGMGVERAEIRIAFVCASPDATLSAISLVLIVIRRLFHVHVPPVFLSISVPIH